MKWIAFSKLAAVIKFFKITAVALTVLIAVVCVIRCWPKPALKDGYAASTALYDSHGTLLRLTLATDEKYRLWVPLKDISPLLVEGTLLYEDQYFYRHPGVNPVALIRGATQTYLTGGRRQGGSTVTMQLARIVYRLNSRTLSGKLEQTLRALQLEAMYSKNEILEAYLNLAPYGQNVEGAAAASLVSFGKRADRLTLSEALALAVVPQSPRKRGMISNNALQEARANLYAKWRGCHRVTEQQNALMSLPLSMTKTATLPFVAPHFANRVLTNQTNSAQITTTLDASLQQLLERQITSYVKRESRIGIQNAAALLIDFRTMEVKALVGSTDFYNSAILGQVNGTAAKRSPGSTLKPFVYALAMDQGLIHPMTVLKDAPTAYGPFSPENFDGTFLGPLPAKDALIRSRNVPAVALASRLSGPSLYGFLKTAGVSQMQPEQHYGLALTLGGGEVTMEELVTLYATLPNRGVLRPLRFRQTDPIVSGTRMLSEEASFMTLDILKDNPRPDQPYFKEQRAAKLPVYWKTGTSWGFHDAWSVGVFGPYVLAVWVGNFDGEGNPAFVGVKAAAPLFFEIVDAIKAGDPRLTEPVISQPHNLAKIEVCAASGDLPNPECPRRTQTWFIPGTSPIKMSTVHRKLMIDNVTGLISCPPYDPQRSHAEAYEFWSSDMLRLFQQAGLPRRTPPKLAPGCDAGDLRVVGTAPQITSPLRGVAYTLRTHHTPGNHIPLQANLDADAAEVFWFVNDGFLGRARRGTELQWAPAHSGDYTLRAVDDRGRADVREIRVEWTNQ